MATADLIKNVFGDSDSDSDADAAAPAAAAKPTKAELRATAAKKAAFAAALGAVDDDDDDDAGGDASDDDGSLGGDVVAEKPAFRSSLEDPDAAGSDSDDEKPEPAPDLHIDVPYIDPIPEGVTAKIFKQTNVCRVEPQPYDPKTFQLETETITHADGTTETRPADVHNVIRWRHVLDEDGKQVMGEDGEPKIESNAKFVRWSDGSLTLHIGEEVLRVTETDMSGEHQYVYARHPGVLQGVKHIESRLQMAPRNLDSATHSRLTRRVDARHVKSKKSFVKIHNPEKDKEAEEREALRIEKERATLAKKQKAAMGKGGYKRSMRDDYYDARDAGGGLDGDFLEDSDDGEDDDAEAEGRATRAGAKVAAAAAAGAEKAAAAPGGYDDEEMMDEDDDEEEEPSAKKKRGRAIDSDSD